MKKQKKIHKASARELMKELEELEPRNIIDYIFKGSSLNQYIKKYKIK